MRKLLIILCFVIAGNSYSQQLPQYTQYLFNLYAINPAFGGFKPNWTATFNQRYQWTGVTDAPRTFTVTAEGPFKSQKMGMGGIVYADMVGPTRRVGAQVSYAYHFKLSEKIKLSLGVSVGFSQWVVDGDKITIKDPNDPLLNSGRISSTNFDGKAGLVLYGENWYFGFSAPQLFQNKMYFWKDSTNSLSKMEDHYFFNGAYAFRLTEQWELEPSVMVKLVVPAPIKLDAFVRAIWKKQLWFGVGYRMKHAWTAMVGYSFKERISIGYSYDYDFNDLKRVSSGTHEIMLRVHFAKYKGGSETNAKLDQ
jgi:type IX secretion system PorP/SprF family membrane protein